MRSRLLCEEFLSRQLQRGLIETLNSNFGPAEWSLDLRPATVGEPSEVESLEFSTERVTWYEKRSSFASFWIQDVFSFIFLFYCSG